MTANTIEEFETDVGEQIKSLRLKQNIDRATLALRAGCSVSALKNLEYGAGSTLRTLVAVVRALGREDWLRNVAPMATISPLNMPKAGHTRQRARASTNKPPRP
jgi:transcriptional regulator with XRE-family HTH domain